MPRKKRTAPPADTEDPALPPSKMRKRTNRYVGQQPEKSVSVRSSLSCPSIDAMTKWCAYQDSSPVRRGRARMEPKPQQLKDLDELHHKKCLAEGQAVNRRLSTCLQAVKTKKSWDDPQACITMRGAPNFSRFFCFLITSLQIPFKRSPR